MHAALKMTHALDAEFGLPPKAVLSQRDVPGLTRSMIPILKQHGVEAVSVGVNGYVLRGSNQGSVAIRVSCCGAADGHTFGSRLSQRVDVSARPSRLPVARPNLERGGYRYVACARLRRLREVGGSGRAWLLARARDGLCVAVSRFAAPAFATPLTQTCPLDWLRWTGFPPRREWRQPRAALATRVPTTPRGYPKGVAQRRGGSVDV